MRENVHGLIMSVSVLAMTTFVGEEVVVHLLMKVCLSSLSFRKLPFFDFLCFFFVQQEENVGDLFHQLTVADMILVRDSLKITVWFNYSFVRIFCSKST
jgi:hypothetical protein